MPSANALAAKKRNFTPAKLNVPNSRYGPLVKHLTLLNQQTVSDRRCDETAFGIHRHLALHLILRPSGQINVAT